MVNFILLLLISLSAFSQDELASLVQEGRELSSQLKDQEGRTAQQKQKLQDAETKLRQYRGTDPKLKKILEDNVEVQRSNLKFAQDGEAQLHSLINMNAVEREERQRLPEQEKFLKCDAGTPEINLENEVPYEGANFRGPFFQVPRDNQDGLGTCFANTAKNLLVGLSQGKDVASFMDMALQYQDGEHLLDTGLDGGQSCKTLVAIEANGFCPQSEAPMETGNRNHLTENLFQQGPMDDLSANIELMKYFLEDMQRFKLNSSPVKVEILKRAKTVIEKMKAHPEVMLPPPVLRFDIPSLYDLGKVYQKNKISVPSEKFLADYKEQYKKFYPAFIKGLLKGEKLSKIFDRYEETMKPFIRKYHLEGELKGFRKTFLKEAGKDYARSDFQSSFKASLALLKELSGRPQDSDEVFADYCGVSGGEMMDFVAALSPLVKKLQRTDALFNEKGEFKDTRDLMQLTVAPTCLNPKNRKKIDFPISCRDGYSTIRKIRSSGKSKDEQIKGLREHVVMGLTQGLPLGNTFQYTQQAAHINTIVGLRFNPQRRQCEYLIRESQTGTSSWLPEKQIFEKIEGLTEVRRR